MWFRFKIYQLNKSRCRCSCKWDVTIDYLTRAIFEKQLTALHVARTFRRFNRYVFILLTKMPTETKTVPSTWYIFNVQGCTRTEFSICSSYCYWLSTWGTSEKRRVAFVSGHLFTFLVVLSLICLVTTQILRSGNQTRWRLDILLRTIVAALLKTKYKYNDRFVKKKKKKDIKKRERNISQ